MIISFGDDSSSGSSDVSDDAAADKLASQGTSPQSLLPMIIIGAGTALLFFGKQRQLGIGAIAGGSLLLFVGKKKIETTATENATADENYDKFVEAIPDEAKTYADVIMRVSKETDVDPFLLTAIGSVESDWGLTNSPKGPAGTGDNGHGRGLVQIDDRTYGPDENGVGKGDGWLGSNDWRDPYTNVTRGAQELLEHFSYFDDKGLEGDDKMVASIAAYNAGPGRVWTAIKAGQHPDVKTFTGDYSQRVISKMNSYISSFSQLVGQAPQGQISDWSGDSSSSTETASSDDSPQAADSA
jgi:soluble lytic murein transglycosylase-like protein